MKLAQLCVDNLKHAQGELMKFLWKFHYTLSCIMKFPFLLSFFCLVVEPLSNPLTFASHYMDLMLEGFAKINDEVDKHTEEIDTFEAVGYTIVALLLTYLVVAISGIIGGAIVRSYFM